LQAERTVVDVYKWCHYFIRLEVIDHHYIQQCDRVTSHHHQQQQQQLKPVHACVEAFRAALMTLMNNVSTL